MCKNIHPVYSAGIRTHNLQNTSLLQLPLDQLLLNINEAAQVQIQEVANCCFNISIYITILLGSGCVSVGRSVASDSRGLRFESSHQQNLYWTFTVNCIDWRT